VADRAGRRAGRGGVGPDLDVRLSGEPQHLSTCRRRLRSPPPMGS
jgi:hypothetical protein